MEQENGGAGMSGEGIPILGIREMSDTRWNDAAREGARAALKDMGIASTKENVDDYLSALREYLAEDRPDAEEVRFCAIPSRC